MPRRVPNFRPRWMPRRDENRPNSAQRGYGSSAWQRTRLAVIARDGGVCQLCGGLVGSGPGEAHIDHIIPRGSGPAEVVEALVNLRLVHRSCHSRRHASGG